VSAPTSDWFPLPLAESVQARAALIAGGALILLLTSGLAVRFFFPPPPAPPTGIVSPRPRFDPSMVIGKAENLLVLILVLARVETGLALLVSAKALVRKEAIEKNPGFFLGGMLVNLAWSLIVAYAVRLAAFGS
jgi:hypothetical protein